GATGLVRGRRVQPRLLGQSRPALPAGGWGIAGGNAPLLPAAALYELLPHWAALIAAAGIAAVGLLTALHWRSQIVAGIGLIGAMLVPVALITGGSLSPLGVASAGMVFASLATASIWTGWPQR